MPEITDITDTLPAPVQRFVLQWGDLGGQWGVNRSVAQIHALLYVSETPQNAEQIAERLGMARSNVSNSLKELQAWRLVHRAPIAGDRRDHFIAETDVWEIAMRIAAIRKQREFDPAIATLVACLDEADGKSLSAEQRARLERLLDFTRTMDRWYAQMLKVPTSTLQRLVKLGDRVVALLGFGAKKARGD